MVIGNSVISILDLAASNHSFKLQKNLPDLNLQWLFVIRLLLLQVSSKILMLLEFVLPFLFYCLCGSENLKFLEYDVVSRKLWANHFSGKC